MPQWLGIQYNEVAVPLDLRHLIWFLIGSVFWGTGGIVKLWSPTGSLRRYGCALEWTPRSKRLIERIPWSSAENMLVPGVSLQEPQGKSRLKRSCSDFWWLTLRWKSLCPWVGWGNLNCQKVLAQRWDLLTLFFLQWEPFRGDWQSVPWWFGNS
jgi:hypothetical protein